MKSFFYIVFGGLLVIAVGMGIAYGGAMAWRAIVPHASTIATTAASAIMGSSEDGTAITGFRRVIRFSAEEEEDFLNEAILSSPIEKGRKISASAYIVKNLTNGEVRSELNSDTTMPIASLTKLATAVVARRLLDPGDRVTITRKIVNTHGNTAGLRVGEVFRSDDLLYPLLMVSSNDAAEALAQHYGRKKFIQAMNDFAQEIGAYRTYFADPSGLSPYNLSTPNDMTILLDWIRQNEPGILAITDEKIKTVRSHTWVNPTHFLSWSYYLGGKNGYTDEANRTAASLFELGKSKNVYAVVLLGSEARDKDVAQLLAKERD